MYNELYSRNSTLKADYASIQEVRTSTKEKSQSRINQLQNDIRIYSKETEETAVIETVYEQQNVKLRKLEEKVVKSEEARRTISNRIQDIKGNISCYAVISHSLHPGNQCVEASPDETKLLFHNMMGKTYSYGYDRVFGGNFDIQEIVNQLSDLFYTVLDGKNITLLNYGVENLNNYKRQLLFGIMLIEWLMHREFTTWIDLSNCYFTILSNTTFEASTTGISFLYVDC